MDFTLNYPEIPILAIGLVRGMDFVGDTIALCRGGFKAMADKAFPTHALLTTIDRNQKYATEETLSGLVENSLEEYNNSKVRIVAMYYWTGWDDEQKRNDALDYLAYIRRQQGNKGTKIGKYDLKGLFSFIPIIGKWKCFQPDSSEQWCSENVYSIHKKFGAPWAQGDPHVAPDQLMAIMHNAIDVRVVLNYYLYQV
jgi:hypothetical protein